MITSARTAIAVASTGVLAIHGQGALVAGLLLVWATATATTEQ